MVRVNNRGYNGALLQLTVQGWIQGQSLASESNCFYACDALVSYHKNNLTDTTIKKFKVYKILKYECLEEGSLY